MKIETRFTLAHSTRDAEILAKTNVDTFETISDAKDEMGKWNYHTGKAIYATTVVIHAECVWLMP